MRNEAVRGTVREAIINVTPEENGRSRIQNSRPPNLGDLQLDSSPLTSSPNSISSIRPQAARMVPIYLSRQRTALRSKDAWGVLSVSSMTSKSYPTASTVYQVTNVYHLSKECWMTF